MDHQQQQGSVKVASKGVGQPIVVEQHQQPQLQLQVHHLNSGDPNTMIKCDYAGCDRIIKRSDIIQHLTTQHNINTSTPMVKYVAETAQFVRCDFEGCYAYFTSFQEMHKHKVIHSNLNPNFVRRAAQCISYPQPPQREGNHRCNICGKSLSSRRCLREHLQRHAGEKPFTCDIEGCGKRFVNEQSLTDHRATHFEDRPFKCTYNDCGKSFKNNGQLRGHRLAVHKPPSMKCQFYGCEYSARRSRHMQVHISKKHSEQLSTIGSILQVVPSDQQ